MDSDNTLAVGIDFGMSNSVVAYFQNGKYKFLEIDNERLIPSAIYFKGAAQDKWIYGNKALRRGVIYPDALFKHFKRRIGENSTQTFQFEIPPKTKYIIDTNIFIAEPRILENFGNDVEILIPKTVYEELARRKSVPATAAEAEIALRSIDEHRKFISMEDSHLELLTDDLFKSANQNNNDRNDNKILSVALFHDGGNTILLSNDNLVEEKASWQEHKFQVQNYQEFIFYRPLPQNNLTQSLQLSGKDGAAIFFKYLREEISKKIGNVTKAIITVPQGFSPIQRNEIKDAGIKAGFTEIELESEPTAAAVAYGIDLENAEKTILVFDFGGGTFDVTILKISGNNFIPLVSGGDSKLGGEDFTQALIEDFKEKLLDGEILQNNQSLDMFDEKNSGLSHEEFIKNDLKIWEACEDMKCRLSNFDSENLNVELFIQPNETAFVEYELSRADFEEITYELINAAKKSLDETMKRAKLFAQDIDVVILAGGTSTIPSIQNFVKQYFGKQPYSDKNPATLIAEGAALLADLKWNQDSAITKQIKIFNKTMTDFGVALKNHKFDTIIPANSPLPIQNKQVYSLQKDFQRELQIECYTRKAGSTASFTMKDDIKYIGKLQISNLPPLKKYGVDVFVTFNLTKEYELAVEVNLQDKQGNNIEQTQVKINLV